MSTPKKSTQQPKAGGTAVAEEPVALPWQSWPQLRTVDCDVKDVRVRPEHGTFNVVVKDTQIGRANAHFIDILSGYAKFPPDFVMKLPAELAATVINERMSHVKEKDNQFIIRENEVINMMPRWRDVLNYADVAQIAYDALCKHTEGVTIKTCHINGSDMELTLLTARTEEVVKKQGDVLQAGITLRYTPAQIIQENLFINRLICVNGMEATSGLMEWRKRDVGGQDAQRDWIESATVAAFNRFDGVMQHSRQMAETKVHGDPVHVLEQQINHMRLGRYRDEIVARFNEEPGDTEWHLLNAITRFSTHEPDVPTRIRRAISTTAGDWVDNFDLVTARMARLIAERVGAEILKN